MQDRVLHVCFLPVVDDVICDSAHVEPPRVRTVRRGIHVPTTWFGELVVKVYRVHEFYHQYHISEEHLEKDLASINIKLQVISSTIPNSNRSTPPVPI